MLSGKDIAELEKKYSKLVLKRRFKSFLIIFSFLLLASSFFYFYKSHTYAPKKKQITKKIDKNISIPLKIIENSSTIEKKMKKDENITKKDLNRDIIIQDKNISEEEIKNVKIIQKQADDKKSLIFKIQPSDNFTVDHSNREKLIFNYPILTKIATKPLEEGKNISKKSNKNVTIANKKSKKPKIDIEMKDIDSIKYLNRKFKKTHDIVFALMLCESYYNQKDYKNSLKWSIIANDIDSTSERSWIWFAKSKYRLHQKKDAIKALRSFLRTNNSQKVKSLLRDIINGVLND